MTQAFTYDANGNRLTQGGTPSGTYQYGYSGGELVSNRLQDVTGGTSRAYSYDPMGNVLADRLNTFEYDGAGRLAAGNLQRYRHNALGQRVFSAFAGQGSLRVFTFDEQGHVLQKCDAADDTNRCYAWFDQTYVWLGDIPVVALLQTALWDEEGYLDSTEMEPFNIHTDHLNTPRRLTRAADGTHSVVWRWDGDAFGVGFEDGNADQTPRRSPYAFDLRFPGQQWSPETWRHYNYFRDYDPYVGRYFQSDPIGLLGGINTYLYSRANPIMLHDPSGLAPCPMGQRSRPVKGLEDQFPNVYICVDDSTARSDPPFCFGGDCAAYPTETNCSCMLECKEGELSKRYVCRAVRSVGRLGSPGMALCELIIAMDCSRQCKGQCDRTCK